LLAPVRINIIILVILALGLWIPDQSNDIFIGLAEDIRAGFIGAFHLALSTSVAGLIFWFTSFNLIEHFRPPVRKTETNRLLALLLPHATGVTPALTVAFAFHFAARHVSDPKLLSALNWRFWCFLLPVTGMVIFLNLSLAWSLRRVGQKAAQNDSRWQRVVRWLVSHWTGKPTRFHDVDAFVWTLGGVWVITAILISIFTPEYAAILGPVSVILQAAGCWSFLLNPLLVLLSRIRVPFVTLLALLACVAGGMNLNDNHEVREFSRDEGRSALPAATEAFGAWMNTRPDYRNGPSYPVFIVAAEGGGIRNAYWTASVLCHLADSYPEFKHHVFAISGVSGGSVGAAVYAALIRETERETNGNPLLRRSQCILSKDLLSPLLAKAAFADTAQQFIPAAISMFDRARALERSLEVAWRETEKSGLPFWLGFHSLRPTITAQSSVPFLIFNTTEVESGERFYISQMSLETNVDSSKRYFAEATEADLPISTAAFLSARFPFVTPAGTVSFADGRKHRYVDGGYFENSGTSTVYDLVRKLATPSSRLSGRATNAHFVVLLIQHTEDSSPQSNDASLSFGDPASPMRALLNTRDARAEHSIKQLSNLLADSVKAGFLVEPNPIVFTAQDGSVRLPLGWRLSTTARTNMDGQIPRKENETGPWTAIRSVLTKYRPREGK
jgi:predicted acylesterase/phospholipase RssA